jgi:DNA repair proteins
MLIHEINEEERPREKAWRYGVESLSDAELLAILVRNGYKGKSSLQIASEILRLYPLPQLPYLEINNLTEIKGIKEIKALELLANFELVRRISEREVIKRDVGKRST